MINRLNLDDKDVINSLRNSYYVRNTISHFNKGLLKSVERVLFQPMNDITFSELKELMKFGFPTFSRKEYDFSCKYEDGKFIIHQLRRMEEFDIEFVIGATIEFSPEIRITTAISFNHKQIND